VSLEDTNGAIMTQLTRFEMMLGKALPEQAANLKGHEILAVLDAFEWSGCLFSLEDNLTRFRMIRLIVSQICVIYFAVAHAFATSAQLDADDYSISLHSSLPRLRAHPPNQTVRCARGIIQMTTDQGEPDSLRGSGASSPTAANGQRIQSSLHNPRGHNLNIARL
jgi:hypothetical protein